MDLEWRQVEKAVLAAKPVFREIKEKYGPLKPWMVFCLPGGQAPADAGPGAILGKFPSMVVDDSAKQAGLDLLQTIYRMESENVTESRIDAVRRQVDGVLPKLRYRGDTRLELRFGNLKYELIWNLQKDPIVDRELTMQSKASIRIVLSDLEGALNRIPACQQVRCGTPGFPAA